MTGIPDASHKPPARCPATSCADTAASAGNRSRQPGRHRLQHRQAVAGDPDGTSGLAASLPGASGSSRHQLLPQRRPLPANRDRHDRAVDAGTLRRPPGAAANGRAATRPAAAACTPSTSTAMITAAP